MAPEPPAPIDLPSEPPLGMYPARMDDKGRIKLPVDFQNFLSAFNEKKFFVTSMEGTIARLYPMSVWRRNQKFLSETKKDPKVTGGLMFMAMDLGAEAEMDSSGRITVHAQLREELDLAGQELRLQVVKGHIQIMNQAQYQLKRLEARRIAAEGLNEMETDLQ